MGRAGLAAATACVAIAAFAAGCSSNSGSQHDEHVLLLSIDGMHQSDLASYVSSHGNSALAKIVGRGASFTHTTATTPSDVVPGALAELTGGSPKTTGIYYDHAYDRALLPAGTVDCAHAKPGALLDFTGAVDKDPAQIDAGQGLSQLPTGVMAMTGDPVTLIDGAKLPVDPATCKPVEPADLVRVNSVFSVAHAAGLPTAWADEHVADAVLNGKGGHSIDDLFTPESDSNAGSGVAWNLDNDSVRRYDSFKANAVVNEIGGKDHSGSKPAPVPAVFGMSFQAVDSAQTLPDGGYNSDGTPGIEMQSALDYVDQQIGRIVGALDNAGLTGKTTIIVTARHGQSPAKPDTLRLIDDQVIIDGINKAWAAEHPATPPLITQAVDDDAIVWWLSDHSAAATDFAKKQLLAANGNATTGTGNAAHSTSPFTAGGTDKIYAGADAASFFGSAPGDTRVPDLYATTKPGTVYYEGTQSTIAGHGGATADDLSVPLVVAGAGVGGHSDDTAVTTTQVAPTILSRLGLDPAKLDAVAAEHTAALPGV